MESIYTLIIKKICKFYFLRISTYGNINLRKTMVESDNFSADWSQLLDDMPHEPGAVVSPHTQPITAGATNSGEIPISSNFATTSKSSSNNSGTSSSSFGSSKNGNNKGRFPWWMLLLLLLLLGGSASAAAGFNPIYRALKVVGIEGRDGKDGNDGQDGIDGQNGKIVKQTNIVASGVSGSGSGADGADGSNGADGADGADGAKGDTGTPGSNDCISGICVSRQSTTPGTQETGNINIDGAVLAAQVGINDTTPSNTLTVDGTVDVSGHSAFGGAAVDGYVSGSDGLSGTSSSLTTMTVSEEITSITGSGVNRQALAAVLKLNPGAAPVYNQINGVGGGVEIASGNTQNFTGNLAGYGGGFIHSGTGTVNSGTSFNAGMLNLSTGTVSTANAFNSNIINLNAGGTVTNAHGLQTNVINLGTITNNYGIKINTPTNGGTVTNNYGLYVADQSSVGSTISLNLVSAGLTSNNWFQGSVGIGNITGPLDGHVHIVNDGSGNSFKVSDTAYGDTSPFVIDSDGDVGIGTATPGYKLDVNGGARMSSINNITGDDFYINSGGNQVHIAGNGGTAFRVYSGGSALPAASAFAVDAAQTGLLVKGAASQSANLQEWQNSIGTVLSSIDENGYLGIGTSDPQYELHISQNATWATSLGITQTTSGKTLNLSTTGGATNSWNLENASGLLYFYNTSLSETSLELQDNGNVGIGTNFGSAGAKLHVKEDTDTNVLRLQDSDGTCDLNPESGSLTTTCSSDERLKSNIREAASVLGEINGLKIRDYTVAAGGQETTGLIAQEVLETNPEMVHMGEDGYYKVDSYNPWKVLKGVQELSANIDNLQSTFTTALEQTNGNLEKTNQTLANLGLRVDDLSATLQNYADQLSDHNQRIQSLEAKVQELEQAN